jgi:hypothetical protein
VKALRDYGSSLTPEQKHEKIRQLHQQAHQQMEGLTTPLAAGSDESLPTATSGGSPAKQWFGQACGSRTRAVREMASNRNPSPAENQRPCSADYGLIDAFRVAPE